MINKLTEIIGKLKAIFSIKKYAIIYVILHLVFFALFAIIPVFIVVGNTISFQLQIYTLTDYIMLIILSGLSALSFTLQIYGKYRGIKACNSAGVYTQTAGSGAAGALSALIGTASCASCIAPIAAVFGLGFSSIAFILRYQMYIVIVTIILLLLIIYYLISKINIKTYESN